MSTVSAERLRELLTYDPDTGLFVWNPRPRSDFKTEASFRCWHTMHCGAVAGFIDVQGYNIIGIDRQPRRAHRLAWLYCFGRLPEQNIDHINGDRSDNRITNLRDVSYAENSRNAARPVINTSGVHGVFWHRRDRRWTATIGVDGVKVNLGNFPTIEAAAEVRRAAEIKHGYHPNHGRVGSGWGPRK